MLPQINDKKTKNKNEMIIDEHVICQLTTYIVYPSY